MDGESILNNRYRLVEKLGAGGMAEVFRAQDLMLERTVAIKILRKDYSRSPEFRERFHQEAKAAANLSHPNIVTVHDFGFSANQLFIVMEYVPGDDLKTMLRANTHVPISQAIDLITQACAGLGYAHRAGLVHCDVKPQNMLVTPDKRLKVVDFGIARALETISPDERSDVVWGSPQYFSPEQATGSAPSPASDVYSLGVIFYEMLCGRLPFSASSPQELARMHREALPPSPRRFNPRIPVGLEQIILKVLSKEPAARYRTADQLGRVLTNFAQQSIRPPVQNIPPPQASTIAPAQNNASGRSDAPPRTYSPSNAAAQNHPFHSPVSPAPSQPVIIRPERPGTETLDLDSSNPDVLIITSARKTQAFDWLTWAFALVVLITLGGLVPFWLWVFYVLNPR